jgi:acetylornithine deacetylase
MPAHKGFVWIKVTFKGRAAHGSRSDLGVDAIRHAGLFLTALDRYTRGLRDRMPHPLLGHGSLHAGTIRGGSAESVYPEACELVLERRTLPAEEPERVLSEIQSVLNGVATDEPGMVASAELTLARPGTEVAQDSGLVRGLVAAAGSHGMAPAIEGMTAWVDGAFLNEAGIPAVCYGPGDIAQAHTADEWIAVSDIVTCADVLETFARRLSASS